jgi:hypothetical protein
VEQRRGRRYLAGEKLYGSVARALRIEIDAPGAARDRIVGELGRRLTSLS